MKLIAFAGAAVAALTVGGCSYSTDASFLGYRTTTSFSTPGAAPPPAYSTAPAAPGYYTEAPPAYAPPPPAYYAPPPVYYGPSISLGFGRWWGRRGRW